MWLRNGHRWICRLKICEIFRRVVPKGNECRWFTFSRLVFLYRAQLLEKDKHLNPSLNVHIGTLFSANKKLIALTQNCVMPNFLRTLPLWLTSNHPMIERHSALSLFNLHTNMKNDVRDFFRCCQNRGRKVGWRRSCPACLIHPSQFNGFKASCII